MLPNQARFDIFLSPRFHTHLHGSLRGHVFEPFLKIIQTDPVRDKPARLEIPTQKPDGLAALHGGAAIGAGNGQFPIVNPIEIEWDLPVRFGKTAETENLPVRRDKLQQGIAPGRLPEAGDDQVGAPAPG